MIPTALYKLRQSKKYLIFLSHVGHEFRGIQKQIPHLMHGKWIDVNTVQDTLETAIATSLRIPNEVVLGLSSRTDAGVHALRTSVDCHLTLQRDVHPDMITSEINKTLLANSVGIRIQSTQVVPHWFSARHHATSRTYAYRFAIRKEPPQIRFGSVKHTTEIPFSEHHRTFFIQNPNTCVTRMQEALSLITGTRDYLSFMGKPSKAGNQSTIKSIYSFTLTPAKPFMPELDLNSNLFNFWNLTCTGRSFLYRQVRRMVGVVLAVGQGTMNLDDVKRLLNEPSIKSWDPRAVCVPAWGLYLVNVSYNPTDVDPDLFNTLEDDTPEHRRTTYALTS